MLRNAIGGGGVSFPGKRRYEGVRFNVISVTRGWVAVVYAKSRLPVLRTGVCVPGRGVCRYPSTGRRRQTGRPNARPRTGCITRRTYFLRIIFKVLRLVYYCASVGADFYSFSYRTSCDLVARDQNLSPLAQPGLWR